MVLKTVKYVKLVTKFSAFFINGSVEIHKLCIGGELHFGECEFIPYFKNRRENGEFVEKMF